MERLKSHEVKFLKKEAHHLNPVVHVGKNGLTDALIESVNQALLSHELIKIKFIDYKSARKELSRQISDKVNCTLLTVIGNIAILYRIHPEAELRTFLKRVVY